MRSRFIVIMAVLSPRRAQTRAASHPACPAPTTITSYWLATGSPFYRNTLDLHFRVKILVIGSGGREHAVAWRLSLEGHEIYGAPGNPGIAQVACILPTTDYLAAAESIHPDLTIVGPEVPLVAGVVDEFRARGFAIVGPTREMAQLEASKIYSKEFMQRLGIPTARFLRTEAEEQALRALAQ